MTRRQLLWVLAASTGGAVTAPLLLRRRRVRGLPSTVHVAAVPDYASLLPETIARAVPPSHHARIRGRRVVLKPNLVEYRPGVPINTDPRLLAATIAAFADLGAAEVVVGEGPGHRRDTDYLLASSGFEEVLRRTGVRFVDLNLDDAVPRPVSGPRLTGLDRLHLPRTLVEADYVVSLPKMKTHHHVGVTLSLKNLFGVLPGVAYGWPKNLLHWRGIGSSILDIARTVVPDLAIVDGITGMEGHGPLWGSGVASGVVVGGAALASVDAVCCRLMGLRPERVPYLVAAQQFHGSIRSSDITVEGADWRTLARAYTPAPSFERLQARAGQPRRQASG